MTKNLSPTRVGVHGNRMQSSARLFVSMLLGKSGVDVVFDPSCTTASCSQKPNGRYLIRCRPVPDVVDRSQAFLLIALLVHECMHAFYTDFGLLEEQKLTRLEHSLQNIFEDVWGEKLLPRRIPTSRICIYDGLGVMVEQGIFGDKDNLPQGVHPTAALCNWLVTALRSHVLKQDQLSELADAWRLETENLLGQELTQKIWQKALEVIDCKSTAQAIELTRAVVAMLKQEADKDQSASNSSDPNDQGEDGAGDDAATGSGSNGAGSAGSEEESSDDGQGEQQAVGSCAASSDGSGDASAGGDSGGNGSRSDNNGSSIEAPGKGTPAQNAAKILADMQEAPSTDLGDAIGGAADKSGLFAVGGGAGSAFDENEQEAVLMSQRVLKNAAGTAKVARQLGRELEEKLEAIIEAEIFFKDSGSNLSSNRIARVVTGDYNVFKRKRKSQEIDTAVVLLLDISSSTGATLQGDDTIIDVSCQATWALGDVLSRFDVPFEVTTFGQSVCTVKKFAQSWASRRNFGFDKLQAATVTHKALSQAFGSMLQRDESRKIVFVVTDGEPSDVNATILSIMDAEQFGIETAVIFVNRSSYEPSMVKELKSFQSKRPPAVVNSAEGLTNAIFSGIEKTFA